MSDSLFQMPLKARPLYMDLLTKTIDNGVIKVLTGMRRCGKSSLLALLAQHLLSAGVDADHIVSANFESSEFFDIADYRDLHTWVRERMPHSDEHYYVLLDEPQGIEHWEKAVNALHVDTDADIYLTGSNAFMLSSQLGTLLSGRYEEINIHPLSFKEFIEYTQTNDRDAAFERYMRYGGLPPVVDQGTDDQLARTMLSGIYNTVVVKDVSQHVQIRNMAAFNDVARFLADTTGSNVSVSKIENRLTSAHRKTSGPTVERYVQGLVDAFLFTRARRYDIKGSGYLQGGEKYYPADPGIRNMLLDFPATDFGFALENIVCNDLITRGFSIRVGRLDALEVDFLASRGTEKLAIQVTASLTDVKTRDREFEPLRRLAVKAANEHIQRVIVTFDRIGLGEVDGIEIVNAIDWLLR